MPHRIITKLRALEGMDFATHVDTENPYLTSGPREIPEDGLDLIDGIIDDCCRIFGTRKRPDTAQMRIMADNGYKMTFDGPTVGVNWQTTVIHTKKGLIVFK